MHVTNSSNLPIEALELEYPLLVDRYELIEDSGGPGRYRGGLGVRRDIRVLCDHAEFSAHADRQTFPPRGFASGGDGYPGRFILRPGTPREEVLPGGRVSGIALSTDDVVRIESPGSGGFGNPTQRSAEQVARDVTEGRVSRQSALKYYRVVLDDDGTVNATATRDLRETPEKRANLHRSAGASSTKG